jgi:hypothetical protein
MGFKGPMTTKNEIRIKFYFSDKSNKAEKVKMKMADLKDIVPHGLVDR